MSAKSAVADPHALAGAVAGVVALLWTGHMYEIGFCESGAAKERDGNSSHRNPSRSIARGGAHPPFLFLKTHPDPVFRKRVARASRLRRTRGTAAPARTLAARPP